jgi:hypothetical protein
MLKSPRFIDRDDTHHTEIVVRVIKFGGAQHDNLQFTSARGGGTRQIHNGTSTAPAPSDKDFSWHVYSYTHSPQVLGQTVPTSDGGMVFFF